MSDIMTLRKFETLSPFEIKDELIKLAKKTSRTAQSAFLNAGRGNPNWIATTPREGFFLLGQFAITESKRVMEHPAGLGGMAFALLFASSYFSTITPQGGSQNVIFVGSGYLQQGELYKLGALTTAFCLLVFLVLGTPWLLLVAR